TGGVVISRGIPVDIAAAIIVSAIITIVVASVVVISPAAVVAAAVRVTALNVPSPSSLGNNPRTVLLPRRDGPASVQPVMNIHVLLGNVHIAGFTVGARGHRTAIRGGARCAPRRRGTAC